jgi:hypothetical protein
MSTKTVTTSQHYHREAFGRRLKELRGTHSQEWLAKQMKPKLERRTIMRLEAGEAPVELHLVAAVAAALGCGVEPLLESLFTQEELAAETNRQVLRSAAYQRARTQAETLDRQVSELTPAVAALQAQIAAVVAPFNDAVRERILGPAALRVQEQIFGTPARPKAP